MTMCGRYTLTQTSDVNNKYGLSIKANFNIAPSQSILAFIDNFNKPKFIKWGYSPSWSARNFIIINARRETLDLKPAFKDSKRCAVIADGWYEWKKGGTKKIPFFFHLKGQKFFIGGVYNSSGCSLVTEAAENHIAQIHHRQPLLLNDNQLTNWMEGENFYESVLINDIEFYPVENYVNSPNNNDVRCIQPLVK